MALSLIVGPPNSGRTGAVLDGFRSVLLREPALVVPTLDDAERFERELTQGDVAVLGATVCTFDRLFDLVARATGAEAPPPLSTIQRRRVAREAIERASGLRLVAASARRPGFAVALDDLLEDLQAANVDPVDLRERAGEAGRYEAELAELYQAYCQLRDELGRGDSHTLAAAAIAALRERPDAWEARPVFLYGFDDLTAEQLELLRALIDATEVTVALPWEDREVLTSARGALFAELRETPGARTQWLDAEPAFTRSGTLFEIERRFGADLPDAQRLDNDGGLALLASAGERAEAECVGGEIAGLLADGVPPSEIAVVLRQPEARGPLFRRVLERFRIAVAVQTELDLARTLTGAGLLALLEAALGRRRASDVLAYLRTPGIDSPSRVDWFERRVLRRRMRDADQAIEDWNRGERRRELSEIERLRAAGSGPELLAEAARQARWLAEGAVRREGATVGEDRALELRAGAEIEARLAELAELGLPMGPAELIATVSELTVPLWRGPTEGRVRVISPYRARARRVDHLFVCSLQDGQFPRRDVGGPLLSDESRAALGIRPRMKAEVEDRYLFAVTLSRAKVRLWLSWRSADDEGGATARSPFVDQVRELLSPALPGELAERDELIASEAGGRGISEAVFPPALAPSEDELARSLAAREVTAAGANGVSPARALADPDLAERLGARLASAAEAISDPRRRPGPLTVPAVLAAMRETKLFGASTLEEFATCPYRWFVNHELKPRRIEPPEEALTAGGIAHGVLERLYGEQPGGTARPTEASLGQWNARAAELITELGAAELPRERSDTAATLRRVEGLVLAFLADEATAELPYVPDPALAEASFGDDESRPPLRISATAGLHGQIDRVDIGPQGEALIQDYKSGAKVEGGKGMLDRGKLQLQLYMLAVRELWKREPAGGLYRPLGGTSDRKPKGLLRKSAEEDLAGLAPRPRDHLDEEDFDAALSDARERAAEITGEIQAGRIGRRPIDDRCPSYCAFQPICRRERGLPEEEPQSEEDEQE